MSFDQSVAAEYKSPAQKARVMTESWVGSQVYCPSCGQGSLNQYPNNTPVGDFFCPRCSEQFELKAKRAAFGSRIVDGEYRTMLRRLRSSEVPSLFALSYHQMQGRVQNLFVIPSHFFIPEIIERRKPLARTARRAGWIGCNILFSQIPLSGRVSLVSDGRPLSKPTVLAAWQRTLFLRDQKKVEARGWTLDVMRCIEQLRKSQFDLADVYSFESQLSILHTHNRHVRAKIRQQLQVLRDAGYLEFMGRGRYRVV
ncbi:MAG TPA: DpnI domain-containing protein [Candidatus Saccharimonadales bacterium]|nr:DpnI domain-containing protein [Candidatus Saccharimonadales bacterium]